jgi:hypothetical protein
MLVLSLSKDGPGLIDEHQALGRDPGLIFFPLLTPSGDLRAILLAGEHGFFEAELLGCKSACET